MKEVEVECPETEPVLTVRETYSEEEPFKEYELSYSYSLEAEDIIDNELTDEIFEELKGMLELIYRRTSAYIDMSWYRGEDDPFKGN